MQGNEAGMINLNNKTISLICIVLIMFLGVIALYELSTIAGYEDYVNSQFSKVVCYPKLNSDICIINKCEKLKPINFTLTKIQDKDLNST